MLKKQDLEETIETEDHHSRSTNLSWLWVRWRADTLVIGSVSERLDEYTRTLPGIFTKNECTRVFTVGMSMHGYTRVY